MPTPFQEDTPCVHKKTKPTKPQYYLYFYKRKLHLSGKMHIHRTSRNNNKLATFTYLRCV